MARRIAPISTATRTLEIAIPGGKVNGFFTAIVFGGKFSYIPFTVVIF